MEDNISLASISSLSKDMLNVSIISISSSHWIVYIKPKDEYSDRFTTESPLGVVMNKQWSLDDTDWSYRPFYPAEKFDNTSLWYSIKRNSEGDYTLELGGPSNSELSWNIKIGPNYSSDQVSEVCYILDGVEYSHGEILNGRCRQCYTTLDTVPENSSTEYRSDDLNGICYSTKTVEDNKTILTLVKHFPDENKVCKRCQTQLTSNILTQSQLESNIDFKIKDYSNADSYIDGICYTSESYTSESDNPETLKPGNMIVTYTDIIHNAVTTSRGTSCSVCGKKLSEAPTEHVHNWSQSYNDNDEETHIVISACDGCDERTTTYEEHIKVVNKTEADDTYCFIATSSCSKCNRILEVVEEKHSFNHVLLENDFEYESKDICKKCGYTIYNKREEETVKPDIKKVTLKYSKKETSANNYHYSVYVSTTDNLLNDCKIEFDYEEKPGDLYNIASGTLESPYDYITYTVNKDTVDGLTLCLKTDESTVWMEYFIEDEGEEITEPIIPEEPTTPEESCNCNCNGTYKILVEVIPATINKPATYQWLEINKKQYVSDTLKEGINEYCNQLEIYKRKQLTLAEVESVELLPKIEGDIICTCPYCGHEIDINSLK